MTYCLFELSINEEVQEKAREDVRKALNKHNGELTYDTIGDMDYLEQCINETLRKYPVVTSLQRAANRDYKVPGTNVVLPKGQAVQIPVHAIHYDEEIYPDSKRFDPDRFTPDEVAKRHQFAHIPFGEGPRICIGLRFAMVEMKIGLARILMRYKFTLDRSKTSIPLKFVPSSPIITPTEKIIMNLVKIE